MGTAIALRAIGLVSFTIIRKPGMGSLEPTSVKQRVGRGALWALAGRVLGVCAQLAMLALLPRFVSRAEFGAFSLLTSLMMIFGIIGMLGLNDGNVRFLAEAAVRNEKTRLRLLLRNSLLLTVLTATLVGVIGGIGLMISGHAILELASPWFLGVTFAVGVVLLAVQVVSAESLRGLHNLRAASFLSGGATGGALTTSVFVLAATIGVAGGWRSLTALQTLYVFSLAAVLPLTLWLLQTTSRQTLAEMKEDETSAAEEHPWQLLRESLPYLGVHLLVFFTMNADLWLVSLCCPLDQVGLYAAARRLMLAIAIPGQIAAQAVMSSIPDLAARNRFTELQSLLRRSALYAAVPAVAASLVLLIVPDWTLARVSGPAYAEAAPVLMILALGNLLIALFGNPIHVLIMTGRQHAGLVVYAVSAVVLSVSGWFAGQMFGMTGVAAATAVCLVLQSVVSWWLAKRLVGVWTHPGFAGTAAAAAASTSKPDASCGAIAP